MTVKGGADVVADAAICNGDGKGGKLNLHSGCQDGTLDQHRSDYSSYLDTRRLRAISASWCNEAMFDRRHTRRDTDMSAWKRR